MNVQTTRQTNSHMSPSPTITLTAKTQGEMKLLRELHSCMNAPCNLHNLGDQLEIEVQEIV